MEEVLDLEDMLDAPTVYDPKDMEFVNDAECEEVLRSEYFEAFVGVLADRNPYYARVGVAMKGGRFIMDLLRTVRAANESFDNQLASEGTNFEEYMQQHETECLIFRDNFFRNFRMPDEVEAVPLNRIKGMVGELTERQLKRYEEKTASISFEEAKTYVEKYRRYVDLLGWRHIHKQDEEYDLRKMS